MGLAISVCFGIMLSLGGVVWAQHIARPHEHAVSHREFLLSLDPIRKDIHGLNKRLDRHDEKFEKILELLLQLRTK